MNKHSDDIIKLHSKDNIGVCRRHLFANDAVRINGKLIYIAEEIPVGHKVALVDIQQRDKIVKYGASIGSAIVPIQTGRHVHLHNMKSDYIASHTRESVNKELL